MYISPKWSLPAGVNALLTDRKAIDSSGPYGFNLAAHVKDDPVNVQINRSKLHKRIQQPLTWINQIHSCRVVALDEQNNQNPIEADGVYTSEAGCVCSVLTADCMPVLMFNKSQSRVAALHAGWRGMANGILAEGVKAFDDHPGDICAWIGPTITQDFFEVGQDVYIAFEQGWQMRGINEPLDTYFRAKPHTSGKYFADLPGLAESELKALGLNQITQSHYCTWRDNDKFYSYRKEGMTGRFASLIWLETP